MKIPTLEERVARIEKELVEIWKAIAMQQANHDKFVVFADLVVQKFKQLEGLAPIVEGVEAPPPDLSAGVAADIAELRRMSGLSETGPVDPKEK